MSTITRLHYSDVLSAVDGRLLSYDGMDGVYRVCDAVAGPGVSTLAIAYLGGTVKEAIRKQHPELARPEVKEAIDKALGFYNEGYGTLPECMEKVVRLLCQEHYDIEHLSEEEQSRAMDGYGPWLEGTLKDKNVVVVQVGEG